MKQSVVVRVAVLAAAALLLVACGGKSHKSASSPPSQAGGSSSSPPVFNGAAVNAACLQGVKETAPGVITIYCSGHAVVNYTVGSQSEQLKGGTCQEAMANFTINAGVITDHTFVGTQPASVGLVIPDGSGKGSGSLNFDGKVYSISGRATVTAGKKAIHFKGSSTLIAASVSNGPPIAIDVSC